MSVNIYDSVNQVASDLTKTPQYMGVQNAFATLKKDAVAFDLYEQFTGLQSKLRDTQMAGKEPKAEDMQKLQDLAKKMGSMEPIQNLMKAEQALNSLLNEINGIILKPINAIYEEH